MKSFVGFKSKCPICGLSVSFKIKAPNTFGPSFAQFACDTCESTLFVKASKAIGGGGKYNVGIKPLKISDKAIEMKREEEALNAAEVES